MACPVMEISCFMTKFRQKVVFYKKRIIIKEDICDFAALIIKLSCCLFSCLNLRFLYKYQSYMTEGKLVRLKFKIDIPYCPPMHHFTWQGRCHCMFNV